MSRRGRDQQSRAIDRTISIATLNTPTASIEVDDPFALFGEGRQRIVVTRSLRDDPVAAMHAAGQIDEAQYSAARRWQKSYEIAGGAGARAVDTTREPVDGGRTGEPFSDQQLQAVQDLARADRALGQEGDGIVHDVLGRGLTLALAGARRGYETEAERKYFGRRFRECLDTLAVIFGYATAQINLRRA